MSIPADRAIAIVGVGAILPDALNAPAFWQNIANKRYSITETPPERWSIQDYYDPDPNALDKTYSKIGGWVRGFEFDWKNYRIPPKVAAAMDESQKWAVTIAAEALADYGYPQRPLDTERTGVILGTAMGGEQHNITTLRVVFPEYARWLNSVSEFSQLPADLRNTILARWHETMDKTLPPVTEDTMPGELANIVSGRVANVLNLRGPNFIADAACASSFAAINAAAEMLSEHHVDAVIAGGADRNMGISTFVKFCKIGALSATGSRPFGDGADGFVMGEGSAAFLLKRLSDAEREGDKIYAVIRGVGASSDGKGKGITAPNPVGQLLATRRAWENAGIDPATATLVEAHGTSTRVGDVVEVESLASIFKEAPQGSIALGSAKSNIGHLKAGAGAAGLLKTAMAIYHKQLPPTLNAQKLNPNIDFSKMPFFVNHDLREWKANNGTPRRAGVSAYGFGGTNFHLVVEEHVPGMLTKETKQYAGVETGNGKEEILNRTTSEANSAQSAAPLLPPRGILAIGAATPVALKDKLDATWRKVEDGWTPERKLPDASELKAAERLVIDFGDHNELLDKLAKARKAAGFDNPQAWKALQAQGIFRGSGPKPGKIAFLFPGQGSQYLNMGRELVRISPVVSRVFADADKVMTPILGRSLTSLIFVDSNDPAAMKEAEKSLMQTAITQPAMLTLDTAIYELLGEYGFAPDMVTGHSLGEYGALIAAGIMSFAHALEASAARGSEMTKVSMDDNGWMAAVMAPLAEVEATLKEINGYAVPANINSYNQVVVGGASKAVEQAIQIFTKKGYQAQRLPVSHAFHTKIVAPASKPLRKVLDRLSISPPRIPLVANVTGEIYPTTVEGIKDILELQIASPVQWLKGLETLYAQGVRTFVEVGPKKALKGFVDDVLASKPDVWSLFTNHPKNGELVTFNQALCGLYAAGYGFEEQKRVSSSYAATATVAPPPTPVQAVRSEAAIVKENPPMPQPTFDPGNSNLLGQALLQALQQMTGNAPQAAPRPTVYDRNESPLGSVIISGTGLGLPGANKPVMDPDNALRILRGEQFVDLIPERFRKQMAAKHITRLVKSDDGGGSFETITDTDDVIKLAGRGGPFNLAEEYGVSEKLIEALDITTQLAIAAGLDALREAGIPLVQSYRPTSKGTYLPDKWMLPNALRDETGVIFASAFPGGDRMADEFTRFFEWDNLAKQIEMLEDLRRYLNDGAALSEVNRRIAELRQEFARKPYEFDRRFIFRILAMGHSQFAELIGARGPNTHVNAACASTAQGVALAEDWIRNGRCRRVIVIGADDVTGEHLMGWIGAGFLSTGAAATDDKVEEAALPFDRRRHGTLLGMGSCALVVESEDAVRERGMRGIVELLASETANSAFHGTRLDVNHINVVMNRLVTNAERRFGLNRYSMAEQMAFVSHETFTPARGGSASAEVIALRNTFGDAAKEIVVSNTKGFTGHPMGAGVEDVIAVKILEYGIVPPVPNYKEVDPDLGQLNLSRGGRYPVQYALHLAAGFGSQISMTLIRRIPGALDRMENKPLYQQWLAEVSGYDRAELEVVKRTLRIVAQGFPTRQPSVNRWQYGTEPTMRAIAPGKSSVTDYHPLPMPPPPVPQPVVISTPPVAVSAAPTAPPPVVEAKPTPAPAPVVIQPAPEPVKVVPMEPTTPVVVAKAAAPAPVPASAAPALDPVADKVLGVVAAKTGYPQEMLDLSLDLEADLGIDTVKQAETFAAVRETFAIPALEGLKLRDYPTLQSVIGFVYKMKPELKGAGGELQGAGGTLQVASETVAPVMSQPTASVTSPVEEKVLSVVAAKTGYPQEMLDLELDLEADLGIDTVKQAETFAAIRESFDIPAQEGLKLRDYPTLKSVIGYVYSNRPDLKEASGGLRVAGGESQVASQVTAPAPAVAPAPQPASAMPAGDLVADKVLSVVAEKTGYPQEMLDLDLDLEADLGVDTVKQAETFAAVRTAFDIPVQEGLKLRDYPTLKSVIGFVYTNRPDLKEASGKLQVASILATTNEVQAQVPAAAPVPSVTSPVEEKVLAVVAEKTGYPQEMLDLDLDLEADLGVDTVKQAETFAAVRTAFDIPVQEGLKLRDYPTLKSVIGFVYTNRPDLKEASGKLQVASQAAPAAPAPAAAPAPQPASVTPSSDPVADKVLAVVAEKTGYPTEMLDLDLDLEADLGVDTVKQAETFAAVRAAFEIPVQENLKLRDYPTLKSVIGFVYNNRPDLKEASGKGQVAGSEPQVVAPAPQPASATAGGDPVTDKVLSVVAQKTGYPTEMLDLDLDLEADLGVDTVKQAETFAAVRTAFDIPVQENLKLRDYPTLKSVINFVYSMKPELKGAGGELRVVGNAGDGSSEPAPTTPKPVVKIQSIGTLADADKMPRRVPVPALRPALELCKPTGVTLDATSRVVVMLDQGGIGKKLVERLQKLGVTPLTLDPGIATDALIAQLQAWQAAGPIQGVYWLPALDVEVALEEMDLAAWRELNRLRVKNLFATMRTLYEAIAGANRFLISATRLGGLHGYGANAASAPLGGAVTGFTKAYNVERGMSEEGKGLLVKAVDFEVSRKTAEPADQLIAETLFDPGIVEVGHYEGLRYTVTLEEQPAKDGQPGMVLDKNSVFVVTGAAGGITSAIVTDLALASQGVFYLLDLVQAPARDDEHIRLMRADRELLKRTLIDEAKARGEKPTPVMIDKQIMGIERSEAALRAVESVEAAGGVAHYFSLDLRDGDAVSKVVEDIRQRYSKIDVLLHAGGLLIDKVLPNKEPQQFDLVFDVKADGFFNLIKAARGLPIGATVAFSSVAGRFGNNGQSDYSSANDLLCKIASNMRSWRSETRGIAIDWTAWGQIGMASRGSVPQIMEALGIDMLQPEAGVPTIRRELTYGGTRGEILVAGRLGAWMAEKDETGGLDVEKLNAQLAQRKNPLLMVGTVKACKLYGGLEVETTLDPTVQPFLFDHQVDPGVPWLPGVMGAESLAELASLLAPGYSVAALKHLTILGAFKFHRNKPQTLYLSATVKPAVDGSLVANCTLRSLFQPPKPELPPTVKEHFQAQVVLQREPLGKPQVPFDAASLGALPISKEEIYKIFFHGPAYQVIECARVDSNRTVAIMPDHLPANSSPAEVTSLLAPRLVELCFQGAALWSTKCKNAMALPSGIDTLTVYRQPEEANGQRLYGLVCAVEDGKGYDAQVVDEAGNLYVDLKGYHTVSMAG